MTENVGLVTAIRADDSDTVGVFVFARLVRKEVGHDAMRSRFVVVCIPAHNHMRRATLNTGLTSFRRGERLNNRTFSAGRQHNGPQALDIRVSIRSYCWELQTVYEIFARSCLTKPLRTGFGSVGRP